MATDILPLQSIQQTIKDRESELAKLRRDFESHQNRLIKLATRRDGLLARLAKVEGEIIARGGEPLAPVAAEAPAKTRKRRGRKPGRKPGGRKQPPLREVIAEVLSQNTDRLLSTEDLVREVLATGYKTKSEDFKNVLWVGLGKMKNVENVKGQGYRIKGK